VTPCRRLVFFTTADPRVDPGPAGQAYHFAAVAAWTGLDAEVRLDGDAVRLARPDGAADTPAGQALRARALEDAPFLVSL
jgi:hypothetical protein